MKQDSENENLILLKDVTITVDTLLDDPKLELWCSGNNVLHKQSLPYNVFAVNILFEYSLKKQSRLIIVGNLEQKQYFEQIKSDLSSMQYKDIIYSASDSMATVIAKSNYHICSGIKEFLLVYGDCAVITDVISGFIIQLLDLFRNSNISEYRSHFFGLWYMFTYVPILIHMIVFLPLTFNHSIMMVNLLRSFYIQLTLLITIIDITLTLKNINQERWFFYDNQEILYGTEYITSYCSKKLSIILVVILCALLVFSVLSNHYLLGLVALPAAGLLIWLTYALPYVTQKILRFSGLLSISYGLQYLVSYL